MKRKGLIFGISLGCSALIFLVVSLTDGLKTGAIYGTGALILSLIAMMNQFIKSDTSIEYIIQYLEDETIKYIDTASIMVDNKELIGALAITENSFVFGVPGEIMIELNTDEIEITQNDGSFLVIEDDTGQEFRFKVFNCDAIVELIQNVILL